MNNVIQKNILNQLSVSTSISHQELKMFGFDSQYFELYNALECTMLKKKNNSILLIGRGHSPDTVLQTALNNLRTKYMPQGKSYIEINLHGNIQMTDIDTILEAKRQFEHVCESKPESLFDPRSFDTAMKLLLEFLILSTSQSHPVFFILHDFDKFASRNRYSFLYSFCELLHNNQYQVGIIGLSERLDAFEMLDKRIKSRFLPYILYFYCPQSIGQLVTIMKHLISISNLKNQNKSNSKQCDKDKSYRDSYNESVVSLLDDDYVYSMLEYYYDIGKDIDFFRDLFSIIISFLNKDTSYPTVDHFKKAMSLLTSDVHQTALSTCTSLQLELINIACQNEINTGCIGVSFGTLYKLYFSRMSKREGTWQIFSRSLCLSAFAELLQLSLFEPLKTSSFNTSHISSFNINTSTSMISEHHLFKVSQNPTIFIENIRNLPNCPSWITRLHNTDSWNVGIRDQIK